MVATVVAVKLGTWAFAALSAGLKLGGLEVAATLAEMGGKTVETGAAVLDRPRDVVRQAAGRLAQQIEREHRAWLAGEFGSDLTGRAEIDGLLAAMPDIAVSVLSDLPAMIEADLDPAALVAAAVARVGRSDERFRPDTTGARLLRCLLLNVYTAARAETEFAKAMTIAVQQALLERATRLEAGQQRIAATLAAGAERLHLLARHHRKAAPVSLRQLLMAELRATDLVGREEELQPLQMWLAVKGDRSDISVHCLTGQGGAGKTRLAIELCEWAERAGWSAGFVHHDELARFHDHHHPSDWQWDRPTLVVVDYAAASARTLRAWLEALAAGDAGPQAHPLRILLLERHADREAGWWSDLVHTAGLSGPGPDTLIEPQAPVRLGPLRAEADRRALLTQAMQLAAPLLSRPPPPLPPPGADPQFDRQLHDNRIETEPLFLVMAGIVAVEKGAPAALALGRLDLAGDVASAERHRLQRLARGAGADESLVLHLAACVTLQGGCAPETAIGLIEQERAALGDCTSVRSDQLETLLRDALPPPEGDGVDAVRPDLIGEAFLLNELCPASRRIEAVERAFGRAGPAVIATVIRTAQDHAQGDAGHVSVAWLQHLAGQTNDPFALIAIAEALPDQTLALREQAAEITGRIVTGLASLAASDSDLQPLHAGSANNLGVRLSALGDREAALSAAREAVEIRRALAAQRPDAFRPGLAMSLWVLADCLDAVGQQQEGLAANAEAIAELSGPFQRHRPAFAGRIAGMAQEYLQRCEALGQEPDQRLLTPVAESLAALRAETPTDPEPDAGA